MNKFIIYSLLIGILLLKNSASFAGDCVSAIEKSMGDGSASGVAQYFDNSLFLNLPGINASYSHAQAEMVLNDFFSKNHPNNITIERTGTTGNAKFAIGTLTTSKGNYRVYILFKQTNANDCIIKELRVE